MNTPPIIAQFGGITSECVMPDSGDPNKGIRIDQMDRSYFANIDAGCPVNMTVHTSSGPVNVLSDESVYADG